MVRLRRRRDRGFTLIELLISLALSMVGLLGLMALQLIAVRGNGASRNFVEATALAQERLEALQLVPFASLTTLDVTQPMAANNLLIGVPAALKIYNRTTTLTPPVTPTVTQTTIQVDVTWTDPYVPLLLTHRVTVYTVRTP